MDSSDSESENPLLQQRRGGPQARQAGIPKKKKAPKPDTCSDKCIKLLFLFTVFGTFLIFYMSWVMADDLFSGKPSESATCTLKSLGKRRSMFDPNWVFYNDYGASEVDLKDDAVKETKNRMLSDGVFVSAVGSCNKHNKNQSFWEYVAQAQVDVMKAGIKEEDLVPEVKKEDQDDLERVKRPEGKGGMIWLGDVVYGDTTYLPGVWVASSNETMEGKFKDLKKNPYYSKFARGSKHVLGVWDDHDMGCNDGGKHCASREFIQQIFLDFLGVPEKDKERRVRRDGVYSFTKLPFAKPTATRSPKFRQTIPVSEMYENAVCTVLLDTRSGREDIEDDRSGAMLGEEQWSWLETTLKTEVSDYYVDVSSNKRTQDGENTPKLDMPGPGRRSKHNKKKKCMLTVIGSGIQVLADEKPVEQWAHFQSERNRLFSLLKSTRTERAVFLSGDVHLAELQKASANPGLMWKDPSRSQVMKKAMTTVSDAATDGSGEAAEGRDNLGGVQFHNEAQKRAPKIGRFVNFLSDLSNQGNRFPTPDASGSVQESAIPAVCVPGSAESTTGGYPIIDITASGFTHSISDLIADRVFDALMPNSARRLFRALGRNFVTISLHPGGAQDLGWRRKQTDNHGILQIVYHDVVSKKPMHVFRQPLSELMYEHTVNAAKSSHQDDASATSSDDSDSDFKVDKDPWSPTFGKCEKKQKLGDSKPSGGSTIHNADDDTGSSLAFFQDSNDYPACKPVLVDMRDNYLPFMKLHHVMYLILFSVMGGSLLSVVLFGLLIWFCVLPRMFVTKY